MTPDEYLAEVLKNQTLKEGGDELEALRSRREEIEKLVRAAFEGADLTFRYGGSKAKRTMIKSNYDLDLLVYFGKDESGAGENLAEIYKNVMDALAKKYIVQPKTSALRILGLTDGSSVGDSHIDVVPGKYTGNGDDVYLHVANGEKSRLKTNIQKHTDHISGSGKLDEIRLAKLWNHLRQMKVKTFVLELLVIKALVGCNEPALADRMVAFWQYLVDNAETLCVKDPANEFGNDLSPLLDSNVKSRLASEARMALDRAAAGEWERIYGAVTASTEAARAAAIASIRPQVRTPARPWCDC